MLQPIMSVWGDDFLLSFSEDCGSDGRVLRCSRRESPISRVCSPLEASGLLLAPSSFSFVVSAAGDAVNLLSFVPFFNNALFKFSSVGLCTFSNVASERSLGLPCDSRRSTKWAYE